MLDTAHMVARLRPRLIDVAARTILVSRMAASDQEVDLSAPVNCAGLGRVRHFRKQTAPGWPINPLPIDPAADALGIPSPDAMNAQVFQNAGCAWRCWYCYVPFPMLAANPKLSKWASADELVELYLNEPNRAPVLDLTGGSPDLTPEWILWTIQALKQRAGTEDVYLWSDDNLSTTLFWDCLSESEREEIAAYPRYGRVACFKGFDANSFAFNTGAEPGAFDAQFDTMRRLIASGLNCFGYVTLTADDSADLDNRMDAFIDRLQRIHPNLPLRVVPLRIEVFSPTAHRLNARRRKSLLIQEAAVAAWNAEIDRRYSSAERSAHMNRVVIR